ncbi:MAG: aspartate/glutamate racemase family protein, partial [Burkholderiaceae bacterium]
APAETPLAGLDPDGELARTLFEDRETLDPRRAEADAVDAAMRLTAAHPDLAALVLECTNLPPYRGAIMRATGLPVYDCNTLVRWLWQGLGTV